MKNKKKGVKVGSRTLYRLAQQLKIEHIENNNKSRIIKERLNEVYLLYNKEKKEASQRRTKFLWKIALAMEAEDGIKAKKHVKNIMRIEEQRQQARAICNMKKNKVQTPVLKETCIEGGKLVEIIAKGDIKEQQLSKISNNRVNWKTHCC